MHRVSLLLWLCVAGCSPSSSVERKANAPIQPATVRVGGVVLKWVMGEKQLNYGRAEPLIREAAAKGAQIVVTTECFLDGYAIRDKKLSDAEWRQLSESIPDGAYVRRMRRLAAELKIHLVAGLVERSGDGATYNTAVLIGPDGKLLGTYHKHDLEHELWRNTPGERTPHFDTPYGRMGLMICADRRNRELVAKIASDADLVICPSGGMWGPEKNDFHLQDRSRENGVPIVFVHPIEFLVTGADGSILDRRFAGDKMSLEVSEVGGEKDAQLVAIYDVPLRKR
jgi:predicted amidohydrolase